MARNTAVFGIYSNRGSVEEGVETLKANGFRNTDISVLFPENLGSKDLAHEKGTKAPEGVTAGASSGAVIGGVLGWLVGIGTLAIPGLGIFIAAGPIMGLLAGVGAGGTVGGIIGGLVGMGIPEYEAKRYEGRIRRGGILISVHCDSSTWADKAKKILEQTGAQDISTASEERADFATSNKPLTRANVTRANVERANVGAVAPGQPLAHASNVAVRDAMSRSVDTIDADASLTEASRLMRSLGVGFLPVRSGDDIVGLITDRDITVRASAEGYDPSRTSVRSVMTTEYASCVENQNVAEAATLMEEKGVRRLLVLNHARQLVGVLSIEDLAGRAGDEKLAGRILKRTAAS
jgi:CBS domain-containing protein